MLRSGRRYDLRLVLELCGTHENDEGGMAVIALGASGTEPAQFGLAVASAVAQALGLGEGSQSEHA